MDAKTIKKYSKKNISSLIKIATRHFNKFIRNRDGIKGAYFICISCKKLKPTKQMNAGHFYSAGQNSITRFDEDNVHGQCIRCNMHLHGNLAEYQKNIIDKIGVERFEKLENKIGIAKRNGFKWDRFGLIEIIEKYKKLNK